MLLYKPDWEETKVRYAAWWAHENTGRCGLWVTAPRDKLPSLPRPPAPGSVRERWYDLDGHVARGHHYFSRTFFGGEALPVWCAGYAGQDSLCTLLGSPLGLDAETGWHEPILTGETPDVAALAVNESGEAFQWTTRMLRRLAAEAEGKALVSTGAFGGSGDTLAALRGTDRLLLDCVDRPGDVRAAEERLMELWCREFDRRYALVRDVNGGSTGWFGLWAPGKFYAAQNDYAYMISPRMFEDLFLPSIERQVRHLDHTVYHVDGVGNFNHVDALLTLPRLKAIQILPGAGKPSPLHYLPLLKKVQAAGRNLHISIDLADVETALGELSARGLFIETRCATEAEARRLLRKAEQWSHG